MTFRTHIVKLITLQITHYVGIIYNLSSIETANDRQWYILLVQFVAGNQEIMLQNV